MPYADAAALAGGCSRRNAAILLDILGGLQGAPRDIVLLNAAAALWVAGRADSIAAGLRLGAEAIDSGRAKSKLDELIAFTKAAGE
jgi:anthranilate phosphoribosyltransferase